MFDLSEYEESCSTLGDVDVDLEVDLDGLVTGLVTGVLEEPECLGLFLFFFPAICQPSLSTILESFDEYRLLMSMEG
jgi:hypothetical protein